MRGLLLVVSGPSGVGKSSIIEEMFSNGLAGCECVFSVSMTTRKPRPGELEGINYWFVSHEKFKESIDKGELLEHAEYAGEYYGTPAKPVRDAIKEGKCVLLDIELKGMLQVKERMPKAVTVYIKPPDWEELAKRLRGRGTEEEEVVNKRLEIARGEHERINDYAYVITNSDVKVSAQELASIVRAERLKND